MITIAQIGCGYWGPNLLRNLVAQPGCRVSTVAETSEERRAFVAANYPTIATTPDWASVLEDSAVDAVAIAVPAADHHHVAKMALEAGKHVLVEKPLATDVSQANELIRLAAGRGLTLLVGHTFLYNAAVHYFRDMIEQADIGRIFYFDLQRLNLGKVRSDVNVWWNLAPHDISILIYLMGGELPTAISAYGVDYLQPGVEDIVYARLSWENRITANIHVSWLDPEKVRKVTVVGSRKMVVYDDVSENKITVLDKGFDVVPRAGEGMDYDTVPGWQVVHRVGDILLPRIGFTEPLQAEVADFIDCIATGRRPVAGAEHGRDVVAVLEAGQRSLERNREVIGIKPLVR